MGKRTSRHLFSYGGLFQAVVSRGLRGAGGGGGERQIKKLIFASGLINAMAMHRLKDEIREIL